VDYIAELLSLFPTIYISNILLHLGLMKRSLLKMKIRCS